MRSIPPVEDIFNIFGCFRFSKLFLVVLPRHIAELIFYMEELRAHVRKYGPVMQRYYVQYLSGFDAVVLNELVQVCQACGFGFSHANFKKGFLSKMSVKCVLVCGF